MNLDDVERPKRHSGRSNKITEPTRKIWTKIDIDLYYQRPMFLDMRILAGFFGEGPSNDSGVVETRQDNDGVF